MGRIPVGLRAFGACALLAAGCQPQTQTGPRVVENLPDPLIGSTPMRPGKPPRDPPPSRWRSPDSPQARLNPPARPPAPADIRDAWVPSGGISSRWNCIVIHHSANDRDTPEGMADWHVQRGWDELGYHFVIGNGVRYPDGEVYVGSRWPKQKTGAHCKVPDNYYNEHGIGICLIGNLDNHPPTARQMEALTRLIAFLSQRCGIPVSRIYTHGGITHKTECPGRYFSLNNIRQRVTRSGAVNATSQ
jgi:hypothetical protein